MSRSDQAWHLLSVSSSDVQTTLERKIVNKRSNTVSLSCFGPQKIICRELRQVLSYTMPLILLPFFFFWNYNIRLFLAMWSVVGLWVIMSWWQLMVRWEILVKPFFLLHLDLLVICLLFAEAASCYLCVCVWTSMHECAQKCWRGRSWWSHSLQKEKRKITVK